MQQAYTTEEKIISIHTKNFFSTRHHDVAMPLHLEGVERRVVGAGYEEYYPRRDFFQLFWSIAGSGEFLREDGTRIPLEPGDVFLRTPDMPQRLRSVSSPWEFHWVAFYGGCAREWVQSYDLPPGGFHVGAFPEQIFNELEFLFICDMPSVWLKVPILLAELFAYIVNKSPTTLAAESSDELLTRRFIALCRNNFQSSETNINFSADKLGVDRTTLRRVIVKCLKNTPTGILNKLRVESALQYLRATRFPINEVARRSGFSSSAYFCRVVRKATGMTPEAYRLHPGARPDPSSLPFEN